MIKINKFFKSGFARWRAANGFTVIEMVVVLGISVILSSILIIYSGDSRKFLIFSNERSLIVSAIFKAKSYSLETYQPTQFTISGINPTESICGWGVRFEKNPSGDDQYYVYKDIDNSPDACSGSNVGYFDISEPGQIFEKGRLDRNILEFSCLDILSSGSCVAGSDKSYIDIFFQPPDPKVIFNPGDASSREANIHLKFSGGGCSIIKITRSSQINLEEFSTSC